MRSRNGTRAGDSSSRTCVSVSCANVASVRPSLAVVAAVDQRLARAGLEEPVAVAVDERGVERRAGRRARAGRASPPQAGERASDRDSARSAARRASLFPQPRDDGLAQHACARPARWRSPRARAGRRRRARSGRASARAGGRRSPRRGGRRAGRRRPPRGIRPRAPRGSRPRSPRRRGRGRPTGRRRRPRAAARPRRGARARSRSAPGRARTGRRGRRRARRRAAPRRARRGTRRCRSGRRRPAASVAPRSTQPARDRGRCRRPDFTRTTTCGLRSGRRASSWSGSTHAIRPSFSSARTMPLTRKRTSPPSGICAASTLPGRSPSASAIPRPTSTSFGPRIRRPSASGGSSKSVWSPG